MGKILTTILLISFLVRIPRFDYPISGIFTWGDGTRDYLVANHVLKYKEFPLIGPYNLLFDSGIYNSPLYFYLLAILLIPFNHILTLSIVNILLQLLSIALVYAVAKNLFGDKVGAVAAIFFSLHPQVLHQSDFIWQPNLMQPIALLALYFLTQRYLVSLILLSLAITLHNSALAWLPVFLLLSKSPKYFLFGLLSLILSMMIFYSPLIFSASHLGLIKLESSGMIVHSVSGYFNNLLAHIRQFSTLNLLLVTFGLVYFLKVKDQPSQKKHAFLILLLLVTPIISASFFNKISIHYLILSLGTFSIFIAKIFLSSLPKKSFLTILVLVLLFLVLTNNLAFIKEIKAPFKNLKMMDDIASKTKKELTRIQKEEGFADLRFFQVRSIAQAEKTFYYPVLDTILLVPLEDQLNQPLVKVTDSAYHHVQIGGNKYLLLSCYKFKAKITSTECLQEFTTQFPGYEIVKSIFEGFFISVYLTRK